ncbi:MAG TPA: hypothetical protein DCL52_02795, partial [Flavobacteriaceae bacterium]|nr:hypothetical protein [Flavobacteriaceae bacterium]
MLFNSKTGVLKLVYIMESQALLPYFASLLSAIIVGGIAYLFFKKHTDNEQGRRRFLLLKDTQSKTLPL